MADENPYKSPELFDATQGRGWDTLRVLVGNVASLGMVVSLVLLLGSTALLLVIMVGNAMWQILFG